MSLEKVQVAKAFGRAAHSYDQAAALQRQVADQLLHRIAERYRDHPVIDRMMDLGSGTGYGSVPLRNIFPDTQLIGLDIAEGMLAFQRRERLLDNHLLIGGDAEQLPLADESIDLIYSSLAVQWCRHPQRLFAELARVLRPGGQVWLSTLGPQSLKELRSAWAGIDDLQHVNEFAPLVQTLAQARDHFAVEAEVEMRVLRYDAVLDLMRDLQAIGAHTVTARREGGLRGRRVLTELAHQYESWRHEDGSLPATYEIHYLCCRKD